MDKIIPVANTISGDEKAWGLTEANQQSPDNKGFHRYQIIRVMRNGHLADWRKDMGLSKKWKGTRQISIPSLNEHTVDELMDLADGLRWDDTFDVKDFLQLDNMKLA